MLFRSDPLVLSQRNSGRVKVLATTQAARVEAYPDIPTIVESGGPEINIVGWFGLVGPAGLPKDVVDKIDAVTRTAMTDPEIKKTLAVAGLVPAFLGSAQFAPLIREDLKRYTDVKVRAKMVVE